MLRELYAYLHFALLADVLTGKPPYVTLAQEGAVTLAISQGKTPAREDYPELSPTHRLWGVMEQCWDEDPERRPTVEEVQSQVPELAWLDGHDVALTRDYSSFSSSFEARSPPAPQYILTIPTRYPRFKMVESTLLKPSLARRVARVVPQYWNSRVNLPR